MNFIKRLFTKTPPPHKHEWKLEYRTGNPYDGKSEVVSCECGQWAIRHFGQKEYNLLDKH